MFRYLFVILFVFSFRSVNAVETGCYYEFGNINSCASGQIECFSGEFLNTSRYGQPVGDLCNSYVDLQQSSASAQDTIDSLDAALDACQIEKSNVAKTAEDYFSSLTECQVSKAALQTAAEEYFDALTACELSKQATQIAADEFATALGQQAKKIKRLRRKLKRQKKRC